jgi:hypothetical protein
MATNVAAAKKDCMHGHVTAVDYLSRVSVRLCLFVYCTECMLCMQGHLSTMWELAFSIYLLLKIMHKQGEFLFLDRMNECDEYICRHKLQL